MADELISFPATIAVLQQLADEVKAGYIDQLNQNLKLSTARSL